MTRFLKREKRDDRSCAGCILWRPFPQACWVSELNIPYCGNYSIYALVPRPPDGTRCRDLDGNIKVVGRDV